MFTGLVEEVGTVASIKGGCLVIEAVAVLESTVLGDSIAVDGCCLTVTEVGPGWWAAEAVPETLIRTTIGELGEGDRVNLERPVRVDGRLGGHIVQGHIDGVGTVRACGPLLTVALPPGLSRYVVEKGSIAIGGVSLTVVQAPLEDPGEFSVALIPHTCDATVLGAKKPGDRVNLEVDLLAKYVEKLLGERHVN